MSATSSAGTRATIWARRSWGCPTARSATCRSSPSSRPLPLYALVRYGRFVWRARRARAYLAGAFGLYAVAGLGSGLRHVADFYIAVGARLDAWLFARNFPPDIGQSGERAHFMIVDSLVEESVELLAAACLLAVALAFVGEVRRGRVVPEAFGPAETRIEQPTAGR